MTRFYFHRVRQIVGRETADVVHLSVLLGGQAPARSLALRIRTPVQRNGVITAATADLQLALPPSLSCLCPVPSFLINVAVAARGDCNGSSGGPRQLLNRASNDQVNL